MGPYRRAILHPKWDPSAPRTPTFGDFDHYEAFGQSGPTLPQLGHGARVPLGVHFWGIEYHKRCIGILIKLYTAIYLFIGLSSDRSCFADEWN